MKQKSCSEGAVLIRSATDHLCALHGIGMNWEVFMEIHYMYMDLRILSKRVRWEGGEMCQSGEVTPGSRGYFLPAVDFVGLRNF